MREIRLLRMEEKAILRRWYQERGELAPLEDMLPIESTFIVIFQGKPTLSMTAYLTNGPMVWLDNFIRNPRIEAPEDFSDTDALLEAIAEFARKKEKRLLFCMSAKPSTTRLYEHLGFEKTLDVATLTKGLY